MTIVLYTNSISPHQLPLARELVSRVGEANFRYFYTLKPTKERLQMGWLIGDLPAWCVYEKEYADAQQWLESCDLLLSGNRTVGLFEKRAQSGKLTCYMSERWFKPALGFGRIFVPSYFKMAKRVVHLLKQSSLFYYLPMGIHGARDMARLCDFMSFCEPDPQEGWGSRIIKSVRGLLGLSRITFQSSPMGKISRDKGQGARYKVQGASAASCADQELDLDQSTQSVQTLEPRTSNLEPLKSTWSAKAGAAALLEFYEAHEVQVEGTRNKEQGTSVASCADQGTKSVQNLEPHTLNLEPATYASKMRMWAYFVAPSEKTDEELTALRAEQWQAIQAKERPLHILWVGRLLAWKSVDTLFKAVGACLEEKFLVSLTIVGNGPERAKLEALAAKVFPAPSSQNPNPITFLDSVPITQVRQLMREHDLYVLPSNGYEGWGAVVSEAIEEQMTVLGTHEAGSSGTVLPAERQFRAGDWKALAAKIANLCRAEATEIAEACYE